MSELEFFRAPNAAAVLTTLGGGPALPAFDGLRARLTDPVDVLLLMEELVVDGPDPSLITGLIWPEIDPAAYGCFLSNAPHFGEPWTYGINPAVRDALAAASPAGLAALRPYQGVEPPAAALEQLSAMAGLARRAVAAGESLYYRTGTAA
ncbi:hypothetical protein [Kitasatospora sp. CB02891]|uniref:hypothetical protein n=1 Tax=Kitasatospora sp. CB02891 TaxID=2020329 RepID=UPI000C27A9D6|nr:hypothetical protein [Kitasatospora sp. CB02891]PJN23759.1 hypothetical protein CG736_21050 [Kitasatospora sp. CB02891]